MIESNLSSTMDMTIASPAEANVIALEEIQEKKKKGKK